MLSLRVPARVGWSSRARSALRSPRRGHGPAVRGKQARACSEQDAWLDKTGSGAAESNESLVTRRSGRGAVVRRASSPAFGCPPQLGLGCVSRPTFSRSTTGHKLVFVPKRPDIRVHQGLCGRRNRCRAAKKSLLRRIGRGERASLTSQFASRRSPVRSRLAPLEKRLQRCVF